MALQDGNYFDIAIVQRGAETAQLVAFLPANPTGKRGSERSVSINTVKRDVPVLIVQVEIRSWKSFANGLGGPGESCDCRQIVTYGDESCKKQEMTEFSIRFIFFLFVRKCGYRKKKLQSLQLFYRYKSEHLDTFDRISSQLSKNFTFPPKNSNSFVCISSLSSKYWDII